LSKIIKTSTKNTNSSVDEALKKLMKSFSSLPEEDLSTKAAQDKKYILYAETLGGFIKDTSGNPFQQVTIKGDGYGYYYSMSDKMPILVPRNAEYYLISKKPDKKGQMRVYSHYKFTTGVVLLVPKEEIEEIGWN
jgi:hypothetical protein